MDETECRVDIENDDAINSYGRSIVIHLLFCTISQAILTSIMVQPITRLIQLLSSAHDNSMSAITGKMSWGDLARSTILTQRHFPKFLVFTMASSGLIGFYSMEYVHYLQRKVRSMIDYVAHSDNCALTLTLSCPCL